MPSAVTLPVHFISHGSPDLALRATPASRFLRETPTPGGARVVLVISAHWMTEHPLAGGAPHPETIHDFGGFSEALYRLRYPAPGAPEAAAEAARLLLPDFPAAVDPVRGLDHGAWIPLWLARPAADLPVFQLSIQPRRDARYHYGIGKRLAELRRRGVWIVASGNATHNLRELFTGGFSAESEPPAHTLRFNDWLHAALISRDDIALLNWERAPDALRAHPSSDHLLPLFVALGATAGEKATAERIHRSFDYGVLSMDSYRLD